MKQWSDREFRKYLTQAGKVISASWGIATVRSKSTGNWATLLLFHDDDKNEFSYAFEFQDIEEVVAACHLLLKSVDTIKAKEKDGVQPE